MEVSQIDHVHGMRAYENVEPVYASPALVRDRAVPKRRKRIGFKAKRRRAKRKGAKQ